jgi:hypothetical protein
MGKRLSSLAAGSRKIVGRAGDVEKSGRPSELPLLQEVVKMRLKLSGCLLPDIIILSAAASSFLRWPNCSRDFDGKDPRLS